MLYTSLKESTKNSRAILLKIILICAKCYNILCAKISMYTVDDEFAASCLHEDLSSLRLRPEPLYTYYDLTMTLL